MAFGVLRGRRWIGLDVAWTATLVPLVVVLWTGADWRHAGLVILLLALTVVVDALSRHYNDSWGIRYTTGSVLFVGLAAVLLGPTPAALIGGSSALLDSLLMRARPFAIWSNTLTFASMGLLGGAVADRWVGSVDDFASVCAVAGLIVAMDLFESSLAAGYMHLVGKSRLLAPLRSYVSLLPWLGLSSAVVVAAAYGYAHGGLSVLIPFATAIVLCQVLLLRIHTVQGRLRSERDLHARYLQMVATAVVSVDGDLRVTLANRRAAELLDVPDAGAAIGLDWVGLQGAGPDERGRYARLFSGEHDEERFELELGPRIAAWHATVVRDATGTVTGLLLAGEDVTERREAERRMEFLAYHDALTGLPNDVRFDGELAVALAASLGQGRAAALLLVDLDDFKHVNDAHGHEVGDRVLAEAGARLRAVKGRDDLIARRGSDEFLMFVPDLGARPDDANGVRRAVAHVVEAIVRTFDTAFPTAETTAPVTMSASVSTAIFPLDAVEPGELHRVAEAAMQGIKQRGAARGY